MMGGGGACAVLVPIDCLINQPLSEPVVMPAPSWCPTPLYRNLCQLMCCPGANRLSIQSYNQPSCKACVDTYAALVPFTIVVNHDGYRDVVGPTHGWEMPHCAVLVRCNPLSGLVVTNAPPLLPTYRQMHYWKTTHAPPFHSIPPGIDHNPGPSPFPPPGAANPKCW